MTDTAILTREELMALLPHRDDMLLLDEAQVLQGRACGKKRIRPDEFFLRGHFPESPVVPGVILCEILAQSVCVLLGKQGARCATLLTPGLIKFVSKGRFAPATCLQPAVK